VKLPKVVITYIEEHLLNNYNIEFFFVMTDVLCLT